MFRETGTITANGTVGFVERIPGEDKLLTINDPGPFAKGKALSPIGPGMLAQQFKMIGLTEQARALGSLPPINN